MKISSFKQFSFRRAILPASIIAAMAMSGSASAFKVDSDNEDLDIRFDNTFRYNAGWRMQEPAFYQANSPVVGASDSKFDTGDMTTNRLDILSEFDFIYKKDTGFRVSAALWYDSVYNNAPTDHPTASTYYPGGKYPNEISRYYNGPSAEFLDAFVFTKFDLGSVPVNVKLGQHTVYWGETIFSLGDGVSSGQSYADLRKALATPGAEAKEIFKPLNQLSFSAQLSPELTLMGQYFFDWKADLFPLGGTFYSPADFLTYNGQVNTPLGVVWNGTNSKAKDKSGDWGLAARWRPEWLDGTAGFYYREYTPKNASALACNFDPILTGGAPLCGLTMDQDAPRTKLYGLSLAKQVWGISWGMDLTYRKDASLQTKAFYGIASPGNIALINGLIGAPAVSGPINGFQAIGDIYTATFNMIAYDGKRDLFSVPLYDSAVLTAELDYDAIDKVRKDPFASFNSRQQCTLSAIYGQVGATGGCVTGQSLGISMLFEPKWFQVWPGTDVTMPIFYSVGLKGNSVVPALGQNEHNGAYSIGVTADVDAKYNFALKYNGFIYKHYAGQTSISPAGAFGQGQGTANAALGDFSKKSTITFTAKATW